MYCEADILQADSSQSRWIAQQDSSRFGLVNSKPFGFRHSLDRLSLFNLPDLIALAKRIPDHQGFKGWQNGTIAVEDGWASKPEAQLPLMETIENIAETNSLVVLKHVEQDPVFGPALQELLAEMFSLAPQSFQEDVILGECLIFLNSPNRKTAYHFDLEPSFLLQVEGEKTVFAWENGDRSLVPHEELEGYCGAGNLSSAVYKPDRQQDAQVYELKPGDGVHFPSTGPHWVQNGDSVSISVNVNFDLRSMHKRLKYAYAVNHKLRKFGLSPVQPGENALSDSIKAGIWSSARKAKQAVKLALGRSNPAQNYPQWQPRR